MFTAMIVEDNVVYRQLLAETIRSRLPSIVVVEAGSANEALHKVKTTSPDLIFIDIRLPDETGLELTKRIKIQHPKIIIVVLTSHDLPEYREAAKKYKADYFLWKGSTTTDEILKVIKSIISVRQTGSGRTEPT
jgi:DNA-binding NarL/FixJ family response regulator